MISAFDRATRQPWAILPGELEKILAIAQRENLDEALAAIELAEKMEAVEGARGERLPNTSSVTMHGEVAVIPAIGAIFRYANLFTRISGATSVQMLAQDFTEAVSNDRVSAVLVTYDSPGGAVAGINETAKLMRAARERKPIVAYVDGLGASAAYWLASAAGSIYADETAVLGSIGVVGTFLRRTGDRRAVELVSSQSPRKRPDPDSDEGRAQLQAMVDALAELFISWVADARDVPIDTVRAEFGQGGTMLGTEAMSVGMIDGIATQEEIIAALNAGENLSRSAGARRLTATRKMEDRMAIKKSAAEVAAEQPEAAEALRAEGRSAAEAVATAKAEQAAKDHKAQLDQAVAAAKVEATNAERARVTAILEAARPGTEAQVKAAIAEGKDAGAYALSVLAAQKEAGDKTLANLKGAEQQLQAAGVQPVVTITGGQTAAPADAKPGQAAAPAGGADADAAADEKLWETRADIRAEYENMGGKVAFLAYQKAARAGRINFGRGKSAA